MVLGAVVLFCSDRDFRRRKMWNPSLKSHIAEAMSSASCRARTGRLLGNVIEMLAAASESISAPFTNCRYDNRDFYVVFSDGECSAAQQSSLL